MIDKLFSLAVAAITQNGMAIEYASDELRQDKVLIKKSLEYNPDKIQQDQPYVIRKYKKEWICTR
jgi:Domain of unknown function (DUF4116)